MTATRPVVRPRPVALDVLTQLREAQSHDLLRQLLESGDPRRRRGAGTTVAVGVGATLCVLAVIALYVLLVSQLGMPVGTEVFG